MPAIEDGDGHRLLRRNGRRQRHRLISTVFELHGHEDHLAIADIFQIMNCEFALAQSAWRVSLGW